MVTLTPPVLPAVLQGIRTIRLVCPLRLLKFAQASHRLFSNEDLGYSTLMSLVIAAAGGPIFRAFEAGHQSLSEWEAFYWAVSSMTTLGSRWEPTMTGSQITGAVVQLVGISFMALLTGAIARNFLQSHPAARTGKGENGR